MSIQLQWRLIKRFQVEIDADIKDIKFKITRTFDSQALFVFAQFPICQQCQTLQKASNALIQHLSIFNSLTDSIS